MYGEIVSEKLHKKWEMLAWGLLADMRLIRYRLNDAQLYLEAKEMLSTDWGSLLHIKITEFKFRVKC